MGEWLVATVLDDDGEIEWHVINRDDTGDVHQAFITDVEADAEMLATTMNRTAHVERLLADWCETKLHVITERSGDMRAEFAGLRTEAETLAATLGVQPPTQWFDDAGWWYDE